MHQSQATEWISDARFASYLDETGGDHDVAVALYIWNARISAAAFETLHHVEVLLRNSVDAQVSTRDRSSIHARAAGSMRPASASISE